MKTRAAPVILLLLLGLPLGCGDEEDVPPFDVQPGDAVDPSAPAAEPAYSVVQMGPGGVVHGFVRFRGPRPRAESQPVARQHEVCGQSQQMRALAIGRGAGVADTVLSLDGIRQGRAPSRSAQPAVVSQLRCRFEPHVMAVVRGEQVNFHNADPILHNVHARWENGRVWFNIGQPRQGASSSHRADRPGVARLTCDAGHTWMLSWVHVFEHPYFAVSADDGSFRIEGIPPGRHVLRLWHEGWDVIGTDSGRPVFSPPIEMTQTIDVVAGQDQEVLFELQATASPAGEE